MSITNNTLPNITIRIMEKEEVEETFRLVDKEGWNLTLNKLSDIHEEYPHSLYVAVTDQKEIIGTVSLIPTLEREFVMGNIVVKEDYRRKGLGKKLVLNLVARHPDSTISLTAVPEADQFYLNIGFKLIEPQGGHVVFHIVADLDIIEKVIGGQSQNITVSPCKDNDGRTFDKLNNYECKERGYQNAKYLSMLVKYFNLLIAKNQEEDIVGFVCYFVKGDEIVLEGLFADSDEIAAILMREVLIQCPETKKMKVQTHTANQFLSKLGKVEDTCVYNRFYTGPRQPMQPKVTKVYNVTDCDYSY